MNVKNILLILFVIAMKSASAKTEMENMSQLFQYHFLYSQVLLNICGDSISSAKDIENDMRMRFGEENFNEYKVSLINSDGFIAIKQLTQQDMNPAACKIKNTTYGRNIDALLTSKKDSDGLIEMRAYDNETLFNLIKYEIALDRYITLVKQAQENQKYEEKNKKQTILDKYSRFVIKLKNTLDDVEYDVDINLENNPPKINTFYSPPTERHLEALNDLPAQLLAIQLIYKNCLTNLNLECTKLDEEKNKLSRQINKKLKIADSYLAEQNEIKSLANPIAGIYGFSNALESSCHEYVSLRKIKKRANNLKKEYFKKRVPKELTLKVTLVMQEKSQSEAKELSEFLELALISKPSAREDICLDWNEKLDGIFDSFEKIINSN